MTHFRLWGPLMPHIKLWRPKWDTSDYEDPKWHTSDCEDPKCHIVVTFRDREGPHPLPEARGWHLWDQTATRKRPDRAEWPCATGQVLLRWRYIAGCCHQVRMDERMASCHWSTTTRMTTNCWPNRTLSSGKDGWVNDLVALVKYYSDDDTLLDVVIR